MIRLLIMSLLYSSVALSATIAIIDTGFDMDHDFLKPNLSKFETDEEAGDPELFKEFHGWKFHDNEHLKKSVIEDKSSLQEIFLFRNLRAKGHREGLSVEEFEWFKKKSSDKDFMELVKKFKKHSHGTFVAGIALREGENINIFPIRGLSIPTPVVVVEDSATGTLEPIKSKLPEDKFREEIKNSLNRVSRKFSKICHYLALNKIEVVNASYGITYKNIVTKFREKYKQLTGKELDEIRLSAFIDQYFAELYRRGERTIKKYPKMLFVFSAGNSSLNNDEFHHYPSRIKLPNTLTVAAMNGDYLASFSNYGIKNVDIGAPGVAILSLVPKVYSTDGIDTYSPSSGTSMAAPYISNLAAQILNTNKSLTPPEVKKIILETGENKEYLKNRLSSGATVDNQKALKAALLSKDMSVPEAINLAHSNLIPMEDTVSIGLPQAVAPEVLKTKILNTIPQGISPNDVEEEPTVEEIPTPTKSSSSLPKDPEKVLPDNSAPPTLVPQDAPAKSSDPVPASQSAEPPQSPSEETPASSSQPQPPLPETQSPESLPSSPQ